MEKSQRERGSPPSAAHVVANYRKAQGGLWCADSSLQVSPKVKFPWGAAAAAARSA